MRKIICVLVILCNICCIILAETVIPNKIQLDLECKSAILLEADTGTILYEKNSHEKLRPASVTKVMTLLIIMESIDSGKISLNDMVSCSERARKMGGSQIWLNETEKLSVNDMLKAICVVSANDCCVAMAEFIAGSEEMFVDMMNKRAKELGMNDTNFVNCHGLDEDNHLTSAHDIGIMSRELIKHDKILEYSSIWMDSLREGKSELVNTNKLIRFYEGANGLKTGSTSLAKYNLSATAKRDDMQLIGVVMCAPTSAERFEDSKKLLDYGFANFAVNVLDEEGTSVGTTEISRGESKTVEGIVKENMCMLGEKGLSKNVERRVDFYSVRAPIKSGDKIGDIIYLKDGVEVLKGDIVAKENVEQVKLITIYTRILNIWAKVGRE